MRGYFISFFLHSKVSIMLSVVALAALLGALVATGAFRAHSSLAASPGDWPTYQFNTGRTGFNGAETIINQTTVQQLKLHWTHPAAAPISTQAVEANSLIYWGSWDGLEHATNLTGTDVWKTQLGTTTICGGGRVGVASTATIASIVINGSATVVDFVGGGNGQFYALNAMTGAVIWHTLLGSPPDNFLWSSPLLYNGNIYEGVASSGDCPVVQGKLIQMNAQTGVIQHTFNVVPNGCTGGGVWGSPARGGGSIYFTTGNAPSCSTSGPSYGYAMVKLRASDLTVEGSWQVPLSQRVADSDFGTTPTQFNATINGTHYNLVGAGNKNGTYYAFNRSNIRGGPIWTHQVAVGGEDPTSGQGTISSSAWDGSTLYVAGGNTTINGSQCQGSLRALNPATGAFLWEHCLLSGPVLGSVTGVPGVIVVGAGPSMVAVNAKTGATLFSYQASNGQFWSGASISNGMLYITSVLNQTLYAFGL